MEFQTKVRSTEVPQLRSTKVLPETVDPGRVRRATYSTRTVQIKCVLKSQLGVNYGAGLNIIGASSPESLSML